MPSLGLNLANYLRNYRMDRRGRTQEWLAGLIRVSRATVNRWERRGAGSATLDEVEQISHSIGVPVSELLGIPSVTEGLATLSPEKAELAAQFLERLRGADADGLEVLRVALERSASGTARGKELAETLAHKSSKRKKLINP